MEAVPEHDFCFDGLAGTVSASENDVLFARLLLKTRGFSALAEGKLITYRSKILHGLLFFFVVAIFFVAYGTARHTGTSHEEISLNDGWQVKYNTSVYEDVDLRDLRLPVTNNGDWIVLTGTLPEDLPEHVTMRLHMIYSVTRVYIDDELVYEYGLSNYKEGHMLGYGTDFVSLPDDVSGKKIKITMSVTENNSFTTITPPELYASETALSSFYGARIFPFAVAVTLIVAGLAISLCTFCLYFKSYFMERLFCIGVFATCVGCWSLCNYSLTYIFTQNLELKTYMEYLSLYLVPFPILLYFREDVEARNKRTECFLYYAFILIEIQFYIITIIFTKANIAHLPSFVRLYQGFFVLVAFFVLYLIIEDLRKERSHVILSIGFGLIALISGRDIIMFNITKYGIVSWVESEYKSYAAAGVLILVIAMLVDFISEMNKRLYKNAETEFLEKIAYVDVLTDLFTRRKCEEIFASIESRNNDFAIIQFDINNLKVVNDDFGHEAGDELIKRFAEALRTNFVNGETLGRMGGDEFIAIISDITGYDIDAKLKSLYKLIDDDNALHEDIKLSVSSGYCTSLEIENAKVKTVYKEADKRMYASKEEYYKSIGYRRRRDDGKD